MGIGRRDFLRHLALTTSSIVLGAGNAVQVLDELYLNRKLGIAFSCPKGWHFADVKEMGKVRDGQILAPESELLEFKVNDQPLPILTVSRDPLGNLSTPNRFSPAVTIYLENLGEDEDLGEGDSLSMINVSNFDVEYCQQILENFELLREPSELSISNCKAGQFTSKFLFKHKLMAPTMVRMRSVTVDQDPLYYTIRMFDSPYDGRDSEFNYQTFLDSFRLV